MGVVGDGVDLLRLVDKGAHADLYKQLGEWIDKVADLQKEKDELQSKNRRLEEQLVFKGSFRQTGTHSYVEGQEEEICSRWLITTEYAARVPGAKRSLSSIP